MPLTLRQREIIEFVRGFSARRGSSPTCGEIQSHFGFASPATVSAHLDLLEKKGAIQRERRKARNIVLPGRKRPKCNDRVPLGGGVSPIALRSSRGGRVVMCFVIDNLYGVLSRVRQTILPRYQTVSGGSQRGSLIPQAKSK